MNADQGLTTEQLIFKESDFQSWLTRDEVRMLIATIPETRDSDVFVGLLRSAFKTGHDYGQGKLAAVMLKNIFLKNRNQRDY